MMETVSSSSSPPPSPDGLNLSQSSLIQGSGHSSANVGSPYQSVGPDLKEQWRILEEARGLSFSKWEVNTIVAWLEAGIGKSFCLLCV